MELTKDIYLYLTRFADDKTILNMLSVNKKYNNEKFFEQVMRRKYPLLLKFKKPEQSWKQFFVGMVYCIAKIEETHGIPYYPLEGYNPKRDCNSTKSLILNSIMAHAAQSGHKDIVELMIEKGATDFNRAMKWAAVDGNKDIVELMIQKGATNFDETMKWAAHTGQKDIVELMIQKGATGFERAFMQAEASGQEDIVNYLKSLFV